MPSVARNIWKWWKRVGKRIGDIQARVLLIVFYFVILAPFALAIHWARDPLSIKPGSPRGWQRGSNETATTMGSATRQF